MMRIRRDLVIFLTLMLCGATASVWAGSWQANLKRGGVVQVDPVTHKPTLYYQGGSTPLWDGVHETVGGRVIIVRDGVAVPDEAMYRTWDMQPAQRDASEGASCAMLVRKACGPADECADSQGCDIARQLERMALDAARHPIAGAVSSTDCDRGLGDAELFPMCEKIEPGNASPCARLVERVCGEDNQCASNQACDLATQLLQMEREELVNRSRSSAPTELGKQCLEAENNAFFADCR